MRVRVRYFASLRDLVGRDEELFDTGAADAAALFHELRARHGIDWSSDRLRVAVNGAFADWSTRLAEGDEVVFLPPVSGG